MESRPSIVKPSQEVREKIVRLPKSVEGRKENDDAEREKREENALLLCCFCVVMKKEKKNLEKG
ncbi:hypothetical protein MTR_1g061300 [Medicago truncatula]|uniref:Uncharacterized protein n=1 Tax=Medicago truncatula TaxID=3880 RepID=A0A072VKF2_MEDTR|nr:hypothetical protein MTR_1g061300 [Medicago truncatula]